MSLSLPIPLCYNCTKVVGKAGGYSEKYQILHCNYRIAENKRWLEFPIWIGPPPPPFQYSLRSPYAT